MSEHTKTPWMYSEVSTQSGHMFKVGSPEMVAGKHGAICLYDDRTTLNPHADGVQHANAAFIVRACNSHEALIAALTACLCCEFPVTDRQAIIQAGEALALARGAA